MDHRCQIVLIGACLWAFAQSDGAAAASMKGQTIGDLTLHYTTDFKSLTSPQRLPASYIPVCNEPFDACLVYVGKGFAHRSFSSAAIRVHMSRAATRTTCVPAAQREGEGPIGLHDRGTYVTRVVRDYDAGLSGLSHYAGGELYRLLVQDRCYEIETRWTWHAVDEKPSEFTNADSRKIAAILRHVVETATVRNQTVRW